MKWVARILALCALYALLAWIYRPSEAPQPCADYEMVFGGATVPPGSFEGNKE